jgi:hypothetical protein
MNSTDAIMIGRRNILVSTRPTRARPHIRFFRNTGIVLVALAMLAGAIAVGITVFRFE